MLNTIQFTAAGFLFGLGVAWFVVRLVYQAGKACGYLEGRLFLVKRRMMMRTSVWVDGRPVENAGNVWVETNEFVADERERIDRVAKLMEDLETA